MQPPGESAPPSESERLMQLYAQLREHGWLKKMFSARRNADLRRWRRRSCPCPMS
jgi:ATP-dependent helicase/nuclease subunit B